MFLDKVYTMLNFESSNTFFPNLWRDFDEKHDRLARYANRHKSDFDTILPRELRLLRVRLKLVVGLKISFNPEYALVKNERTAKAYIEIIKCNEAWFTYEALIKLCALFDWKKTSIKSPVDIFDAETFELFEMFEILSAFNATFNDEIYATDKIAKDIEGYLAYMEHEIDSNSLKAILIGVKNKITLKQPLLHKDILAIIYGTRNIFVHKGESAKAGTKNYKNKILLLRIVYDYMILFLLKVTNLGFDKQLEGCG